MDTNHTEVSLSFPTFPRFCGQTFLERKDKELADLCVKAYNDWMFDEWCAGTNGRLVPLPIVQLWDAKEKEARAAVLKSGAKIIPNSEIDKKSFVDVEKPVWDKFASTPELKSLLQEVVNAK